MRSLPVLSISLLAAALATGCAGPTPANTLRAKGDHSYKLGAYDDAATNYREIAQRYPGDWRAQYQLGLCELELGHYGAARSALQIALDHQPHDETIAMPSPRRSSFAATTISSSRSSAAAPRNRSPLETGCARTLRDEDERPRLRPASRSRPRSPSISTRPAMPSRCRRSSRTSKRRTSPKSSASRRRDPPPPPGVRLAAGERDDRRSPP